MRLFFIEDIITSLSLIKQCYQLFEAKIKLSSAISGKFAWLCGLLKNLLFGQWTWQSPNKVNKSKNEGASFKRNVFF